MKVAYAPRALRDIGEILEYVHTRSPSGARNVSLAIEYSVHACALAPRAGPHRCAQRISPTAGQIPLHDFSRTRTDGIEVIRVVHSARVRQLGNVSD